MMFAKQEKKHRVETHGHHGLFFQEEMLRLRARELNFFGHEAASTATSTTPTSMGTPSDKQGNYSGNI